MLPQICLHTRLSATVPAALIEQSLAQVPWFSVRQRSYHLP